MNEAKRLTGYSYKLMGLGNIPGLPAQEQANQFGLDVSFGPDDLEIDENEMSCVIPFADGNRVDGSGDVIEVAGIRTERHRANPIVLFDHGKQVTLPVALSEDPITKLYTVEIDPIAKKAKGKAFFYQGKWGGKNFNGATEYDHALFCEQLFDLLAKRYIRAGSIGYQVMKGLPMQGTYGMGIPQGVHLQEVNMLEYSAVVLPCNQDTVGKALSLKRVCGKPLSTHLVKSLSPYAPPRKVQMGYEGQKALTPEENESIRICQSNQDADKMTAEYQEKLDIPETAVWRQAQVQRARNRTAGQEQLIKQIIQRAAERDQEGQKSFSALLKSLREKYRKNYDMEELEGNMKSHPKDDPYDLDSQRIPPRENTDSGSWIPDDEDMQEVFNGVFGGIPGLAIPDHPHGFNDEKALPVQQGESLFSIGSSVDLKKLSEALTFLKSMTSEGFSLDETGRAKCYHYAKSLMPYGRKGDLSQTQDLGRPDPELTEMHAITGHYNPKQTMYGPANMADLLRGEEITEGYEAEYANLIHAGKPNQTDQDPTAVWNQLHKRPVNYSDQFPIGGFDFRATTYDPSLSRDDSRIHPERNKILSEIPEKTSREHFDQRMDLRNQAMMQDEKRKYAEKYGIPQEMLDDPSASPTMDQVISQNAEKQGTPQESSDEWTWDIPDQSARKSLERIIKMALPHDYEVGREVVHSFPPQQAGESELHLRPSQSMRTAPRETTDHPDVARVVYGDGSEGLRFLHNFTYADEVPNPPQEEDE